ncbi:DUF4142 domain-containing protein [Beijerinckia sp. L45]|uniref:DUF4142 domain-containing protein n=1 Tax=Beijerinckia sp. L45 TaxID=1641855 RepID=UPI00131D0A2A|nr:DUF4142 domain-containing protein [Beijerinckia sp. L45]
MASRISTQIAALALCLSGGLGPVQAQSLPLVSPQYGEPPQPTAITVRLLALARPTVAFLARSSDIAERQASQRLRGFARREAREQNAAETALDAAATPTLVTGDPLDAAAVGAASIDEGAETILSKMPRLLQTPGARAIAADRAIATAARADLGQMAALDGRTFDALYVETQTDGLRRLITLYRDYTQNGDDETLRAVTVHELPRVIARLTELGHSYGARAVAKAER